jgi:hypothetical protein
MRGKVQWLRAALSTGPNSVDVFPSNLRTETDLVVFSNFWNPRWWTNSESPVIHRFSVCKAWPMDNTAVVFKQNTELRLQAKTLYRHTLQLGLNIGWQNVGIFSLSVQAKFRDRTLIMPRTLFYRSLKLHLPIIDIISIMTASLNKKLKRKDNSKTWLQQKQK